MRETGTTEDLNASNPFSSRFTHPDKMDFQFAPGPRLQQIMYRLWDTDCWGEIVGPHGSGKSTLIALLVKQANRFGISPHLFSLHDKQRAMPTGWKQDVWDQFEPGRKTMVIVDGFEQLSRFARWRLRRTCSLKKWGLLVTAHTTVDLPTLYRTATSMQLTLLLVDSLQQGSPLSISPAQIEQAYQRHNGNLRLVFHDLFDQYERLR